VLFILVETVALLGIAVVGHSFPGLAITFVIWGLSAFTSVVPLQHRLLAVDTRPASVAISWYSSAVYVGVAVAPLAGAAVIGAGAVAAIPIAAAAITVVGLAFVLGYALRRSEHGGESRGSVTVGLPSSLTSLGRLTGGEHGQ
jgi:predicted MFS family arabinose efflux permease